MSDLDPKTCLVATQFIDAVSAYRRNRTIGKTVAELLRVLRAVCNTRETCFDGRVGCAEVEAGRLEQGVLELSREHIVDGFPVNKVAVLIHLVTRGVVNVGPQTHRVLTGSRLLSEYDIELLRAGCLN